MTDFSTDAFVKNVKVEYTPCPQTVTLYCGSKELAAAIGITQKDLETILPTWKGAMISRSTFKVTKDEAEQVSKERGLKNPVMVLENVKNIA